MNRAPARHGVGPSRISRGAHREEQGEILDRARRRELKHAGVLAARHARVDLATTIAVLEESGSGDEGRQLAGRLSFAVGALYGAEVGEPEGVRDRLREASGVLSGVLARLSEPGIPRALDDAGASVAKCLAVLYPARAGLERELEAATDASGETSLSSPFIEVPARDARGSLAALEAADEPRAREKKITSPGVAPPSNPMIPVAQLTPPEPTRRAIPPTREHALRVSGRTLIRGSDTDDDVAPPSEGATKISRPPPALLREATPDAATTSVGRPPSAPPGRASDRPENAVPLKRKRRKALELVPDADEGLVDRSTGSPVNEPGSERRTTERVSLDADIGLHSATQFFTGLSGDVSRGGLFVATWAPLPLGTEVTVSFVLPGGYQITAPGRVAWLKEPQTSTENSEDTPGMGVRFTTLSDADREAIEQFLARRPAMLHEV
jgi:uncharacterized protein (TIGR02266 family)